MTRTSRALFGAAALLACQAASAVVIDFEGFATGTIVDDEYSSLGVSISATNLSTGPDLAVIFDSNDPTGGDTDLGAPFSGPLGNISPGNLLILQENSAGCDAFTCSEPDDEGDRPAGVIRIDFDAPVTLLSIDFFDIEGAESGGEIQLIGAGGLEILAGGFSVPDTGGDNTWEQVVFGVGGVEAIVINMGGSGGLDNIRYVVPLPPALALFGGALLALGASRRRRHTV